MVFKSASTILLITVSILIGSNCSSLAAETKEEVIEALKNTELPNGSMDGLNDKQLSEIALLSKTVEAKRDLYARALELYIERIGAGKDVDQALIEYERAEISLAAEWKETRKVLEIIKKQDKLAHDWKRHRTLHPPEHHNALDHHASDHAPEHPDEQHQHAEHHS